MLALIALLTAAAAPAGPIYLTCTSTQRSGAVVNWKLGLDERRGTVDIATDLYGGRFDGVEEASFSPLAVTFDGMTLSRVDMSMTRYVDGGVERGRCSKMAVATNRAF